MPALTPLEYLARDLRLKCLFCRRWMQRASADPEKTPATRSARPNAAYCTDCIASPDFLKRKR